MLFCSLVLALIIAVADIVEARSPPKPTTTTSSSSCVALPLLSTCGPSGYDKNSPPELLVSGGPTSVKIQIYLENFGRYYQNSDLYDIDFYFVEFWNDTRLSHTNSRQLQYNSREQLDRIWQPDLYFANGIDADVHDVVVPNLVLKIQPSGLARLSTRVHLKVPCKQDSCSLKIVSYGNTKETLDVKWIDTDKPIQLNPEIAAGGIRITKPEATDCGGAYFGLNFNCLKANFQFKPK